MSTEDKTRIDQLEQLVYKLWSLIDRLDDRMPFMAQSERHQIQREMFAMLRGEL